MIVNDYMINGTGLETLCEKANTKVEFLSKTAELFKKNFKESILEERKSILQGFNPENSAKKIIDIIFKQ